MMRLGHCLTVFVLLFSTAAQAQHDAAVRFAEFRSSPPMMRAFLFRMPKGGDLHSHLTGAAYAEAALQSAAGGSKCIDPDTSRTSSGTCAAPARPTAELLKDYNAVTRVVDAWSMRSFVPANGVSGHDHFFDTFGKFSGAATPGDLAADVIDRAGRQRMRYLELMITFQGPAVSALADQVAATTPWKDDPAQMEDALRAAGIESQVEQASHAIDTLENRYRKVLQCGTPVARPGCDVTVRWLQQVTRTAPPHRVFATALFGAMLQARDHRVAGINFVAPEDNPVALADYTRQMKMLDYLYGKMPGTNIALHAGELTMGLVPPGDLLFHVRQAVELGHAKRIGHGVDIMYEDDPFGLLREMAQRHIAVEINLTSNDQILGVSGKDHPFPIYRSAGVPVVLSTDDEGVERTDRTHELQRAVATYNLSWAAVIDMERNTLQYAFVEGKSLWADTRFWRMVPACATSLPARDPLPGCAAFLKANEKARLQWSLEHDLIEFEADARKMRLAGP